MRLVSYFSEHMCRIKSTCYKDLASLCAIYFHQNHPSSTERIQAADVPQAAISYLSPALFLNCSTMSIFSCVFLLLPQFCFSPSFCLFSITYGMFVCLYKLLLLPLAFMFVVLGIHLHSADGKPVLSQQEAAPHSNHI